MATSWLTDTNSRRTLRGTIGFSPIFALLIASQPGTALAATLPASNVVSVCSGVSLPRSVVTDIMSPVITGTITPLQTSVNSLLAGVLGTPVTVNAAQLLSTAASGQPITLQAISNNGTVIGPGGNCYSQASGFTLSTPAGLAIGGNQITGLGSGSATASAGELNSIAFGNGASTDATAAGAIALGNNAAVNASATGGVALGNGASVSAADSVALGAASTATRGALSNYAAYALTAPQTSAGEVSIGAAGAARQLTNVAAGSSATDAVNVAQLTAVNGQVTTNTTNIATIQGVVSANSTAITANTNAIGTLSNLAVEYTNAGQTAVTLGGTGAAPVALTNVQAAPLSATSTAAVNGSQLFATNTNVATNATGLTTLGATVGAQGTQITANTNAIGTLSNLAVEYTNVGQTAVTLGGIGAAPVALTNVQAAPLSASSTAAVNGSQLFATNTNVATNATGLTTLGATVGTQGATLTSQGTQITANTNAIGTLSNLAVEYTNAGQTAVTLGGTGAAPVALTNVQAAPLSATSTAAVNGSQLFATNTNVATNATGLTTLGATVGTQGTQITANTNAIGTLSNLAVEYTNAGQTAVTLGGTGAAPVALTNVQAAPLLATSTAAVNGSQLFATNANVATNATGLATLGATVGTQGTTLAAQGATLATQGTQITANSNAIGTLSNLAVEYTNAGQTAVTLGGTGAAPVALTNVQAATLSATSTAAVNGSQLFATNANVATNATGLTTLGTTVSTQGTTLTAQGSQITANTNAIGTLSNLAVEYTNAGQTAVTLGGTGAAPVALTNVQATPLSATSTAAVNGSQLFATNTNVATNTASLATLGATVGTQGTQIATNSGDIGTLQTAVGANTTLLQQQGGAIGVNANAIVTLRQDTADGAIGPVQYSNATAPTVPNGGTPSNDLTLVGRDPTPVGLHNVANGVVAAGSTDGVNGGQLFTLGNQIGSLSSLAVEYVDPTKTTITLGNGTGPVLLHNVQAGTLGATSTDAVNGSQLFATNGNVAANTASISANTTAIGVNTSAIGVNAGAIVALRQDTADGAIGPVQYSSALASTTPDGGVPSNDLTLTGAIAGPVGLHNVANGSVSATSTDAVNGSQLFAVDSQIGSLSTLGVQYDSAAHASVTFGGTGAAPVALHNVASGTLTATSNDAVNGAQLFATNAAVMTNTGAIATNTGDIASLTTTVGTQGTAIAANGAAIDANANALVTLRTDTADGAIGPVQYSFAATPTTPNGGVPSNDLTLVGANAAPVALHNVAAGTVTQGSTDAVNGGQLFALSTSVGSLSGLAVQYDDASRTQITLSNPAGTPVTVAGVAAGTLSASSTQAVNGAQLFATDQSVATLTTNVAGQGTAIVNLGASVSNGGIGPVQYSDAANPATPDGGVPSQDLTLVGANAGPVALHNVAAATLSATSTDAVNGSQLFATNQSVATLTTNVDSQGAALTSLGTAVGNGGIGPVQYSNAASPTTSDGGVPSQDLTLVGANSGPVALHNLAAGSLASGSTDAVNGGQLGTLGMATASVFGAGYTYNPTTNSYSGSFSYGGTDYSNLQSVLGAIQTSVASGGGTLGDDGIKYFHTTSSMADSSATGADSTAIGPSSTSSGQASIAVGRDAAASGDGSVAIGDSAMAQGGKAVSIGFGNTAMGDGAVAIGDPNVAMGVGAAAIGENNTATGDGAIALGNTNSATGMGAAAIGYVNTSNGNGATTIGYQNNANGNGAVAIGSNNVATGDQSLAIGTNVQTTATDTLAIGSGATSSGVSSVTVGNRTVASGANAVAVGNDASASGLSGSAFGVRSNAAGIFSLAQGGMSAATGFASTALGAGTTASGFGSAALGTGAVASEDGSVALGSASQTVRGAVADYSAFGLSTDQSSAGEIAIARSIVYTDPVTGLPTLTGTRQITGVAAGSADTDAVNVSQLRGVSNSIGSIVAAGLGGGSSYNPTTGQLIAPSYTLGGVTYGNVGDALQALASSGTGTGTTGGTGGSVNYADPSHATVTLAATGTTIQNVAPGAVTPTSTDAVNGSQLAATNAAVATNTTAISTLATQVNNGAVGVVRYSNSSAPTTANGGTQTNDATLVGQNASAPVALHNVAAGSVAVGSTDAVNGGQLAATNTAVATAQTTANTALTMSSNSVQYDSTAESSVTLGNASSGTVSVHNVAPGITPTDAANVGQVAAAMTNAVSQANGYTDGRIAALSFDLKNVQRDANAGAAGAMALAGMPQPYEAGKGMVSMGAGTFQGQTAIALGVAKALNDGHTVVKLGATYNSRGMVGGNAGVGWQF